MEHDELDDDAPLPPGIVRASEPHPPTTRRGRAEAPATPTNEDAEAPATVLPAAGRITAIEPQARRQGRVNVYVDGEFAIGLFDDVAHTLGLHVGQPITAERLAEISAAETLRRATEDAYHLLSFRARAEKEITDRLTRKGYEEDVVTAVLDKLRASGYVDDASFAQSWVAARGKTRGRRALAHELRQKGVASEVAGETLDDAKDDEAERAAAHAAAVKKVGARPADQSREAKARLAAFLQRRGFGWESIRPVLAALYAAPDDADGAEEIAG